MKRVNEAVMRALMKWAEETGFFDAGRTEGGERGPLVHSSTGEAETASSVGDRNADDWSESSRPSASNDPALSPWSNHARWASGEKESRE